MLQNSKELHGCKLAASDGDIGHVRDFYFDDKTWVVRYLVADTGSWLAGRLVLLSPHSLGKPDREERTLPVMLSKKQIEDSPSIDTHQPVSRQYEIEYYRYYGWPTYWDGGAMWGLGAYPVVIPPSKVEIAEEKLHHHRADKHLQSMQAVNGYQIQTVDGAIGTVGGFMVDDSSWAIRELVVETGHWYAGRQILISPDKIQQINYQDSSVLVNLTKADIQRTAEHHLVHAGAGKDAGVTSLAE